MKVSQDGFSSKLEYQTPLPHPLSSICLCSYICEIALVSQCVRKVLGDMNDVTTSTTISTYSHLLPDALIPQEVDAVLRDFYNNLTPGSKKRFKIAVDDTLVSYDIRPSVETILKALMHYKAATPYMQILGLYLAEALLFANQDCINKGVGSLVTDPESLQESAACLKDQLEKMEVYLHKIA